jgi:hypothetical protein
MKKILKITSVDKDENDIFKSINYEIAYICKDHEFTKKYEFKDNDVFYINSDCSIPRFKLKTFCENNNCKVTRDITKATALFASSDLIKKETTSTNWTAAIQADIFKDHLKRFYPNDKHAIDLVNLLDYKTDIDMVLARKNLFEKLSTKFSKLQPFSEAHDYQLCSLDNYNKLDYIITHPNVYHQDDLLKIINGSIVMDTEMYDQISNMLESNDNNDTKLAMELIANLDYDACAVYILLLFKNFGSKMWDSGYRHHVNFKSLLNYFDVNQKYSINRIDLDDIVTRLKNKNLLTDDVLKILMPIAEEEIKDYVVTRLKNKRPFTHFKVKEIEFQLDEDKEEEDEEFVNTDEEPAY